MSNAVCLTAYQQKFYNYFNNFAKSNGYFPSPAQVGRDLKCTSACAIAAYGNLLLKGAFTGGQPLTLNNRARHHATPIQPMNIATFKANLDAAKVARMDNSKAKSKAKAEKKPSLNKRQLAALLVKLLTNEETDVQDIASLLR